MSNNNVRIQNLRDFTVQIRHATTDAIVGTGFVVSTSGQVVTCVHVVRDASIERQVAEGVEVGVYFPQVRNAQMKAYRARVVACFPQYDDDVVLLQLVEGASPLAPEQVAVLGTADESEGHTFRSYGYRRLESYIAGRADGKILGDLEPPEGRELQVDPVQLDSSHINSGMSGSAVLDVERNLVVGIISETWFPDESLKDFGTAWAVNARVLTFNPMNLSVQDMPFPKQLAPQPKPVEPAEGDALPRPGVALNNTPPPLEEWVGREELLKGLDADWLDTQSCCVTGLIGFGGEGKSSLARRWLDNLRQNSTLPQPDGIFWWGFNEKNNPDEFFEAALTFISSKQLNPSQFPSASAQAHLIAAMLSKGRYLFILDGLEELQHQEGDNYGLLTNSAVREFLSYFAAGGHTSFCLITSRAPVLDLIDYTTYTHRDVDRLSLGEGLALLRKIGVQGSDEALGKVVQDWDGHALTLSLLGAYLVDRYEGKVEHISDIPAPNSDEPLYERVRRVLHRYDEHLTEAERAFLTIFSAFRLPVKKSAFAAVFQAKAGSNTLKKPIAALNDTTFSEMVGRLVNYRILRQPQENCYTTHPLIRSHYLARLSEVEPSSVQRVHRQIAEYYLKLAGKIQNRPTLEDLTPLIEAVHHLCKARDYSEGCRIFYDRIDQRNRWILANELGAFETGLSLLQEFFPSGNLSENPQVSSRQEQRLILRDMGFFLMCLGRLEESASFYERALDNYVDGETWGEDSIITLMNLTELYAHLGRLDISADAARKAVALCTRLGNRRIEPIEARAWQAWISYLCGELQTAKSLFQKAQDLERADEPGIQYLYAQRGIRYADYLRRVGDTNSARKVTEANLEVCKRAGWVNHIGWCYRVLGDLDADAGQFDSARQHYDKAIKKARATIRRDLLIPVLTSRGRWAARLGEVDAARSDLKEALNYADASGYRIYEVDIRVGLAWAHLKDGNSSAARTEAEQAKCMSAEMGYHWGQVDGEEVLAVLDLDKKVV